MINDQLANTTIAVRNRSDAAIKQTRRIVTQPQICVANNSGSHTAPTEVAASRHGCDAIGKFHFANWP